MTTKHVVADDALGMVSRRRWEIERRMMEGTLAPEFVADNFQLIAQGRKISPLTSPNGESPFFTNEEVPSTYGYPDNYKVRPVYSQLVTLSRHFPMLRADSALGYEDSLFSLPQGAEGAFAIPQWQKVAKTYGEACEHVFKALASTRKFTNYRVGQLGPKYLKQTERSEAAFAMLAQEQKCDFLVVPAQFGLLHRGRSVRRVRIVYQPREFDLGAFDIGCMLLAHPEREVQWKQLHIDAPGDEFAPDADGEFVNAPFFSWYDGEVEFHTRWVSDALASYGSVSGFIPQ